MVDGRRRRTAVLTREREAVQTDGRGCSSAVHERDGKHARIGVR